MTINNPSLLLPKVSLILILVMTSGPSLPLGCEKEEEGWTGKYPSHIDLLPTNSLPTPAS